MKIADINKIIRELWAMTYSGEDIDMIEIVSGDEGEDGARAKRLVHQNRKGYRRAFCMVPCITVMIYSIYHEGRVCLTHVCFRDSELKASQQL